MDKMIQIAFLAKDPQGESVLVFDRAPRNGAGEEAETELQRGLAARGHTVLGSFHSESPAWRQMVQHSELGVLPDPHTAGWLATISEAYHQAKRAGGEYCAHQLLKLREIQAFLNTVERAGRQRNGAAYRRTASNDEIGLEICRVADVEVLQLTNTGMWQWRAGESASERTFHDPEEARLDAVSNLFPRQDWAYEAQNGDTDLGYFEWALDRAEQEAQEAESQSLGLAESQQS